MVNTASNVSVGKPGSAQSGGGIWIAPLGTPLPTNTTSPLDPAFKHAGFITQEGLANSNSRETTTIKDWNGDTVLTVVTGRDETYKFVFLETNEETLKAYFGSANVTKDPITGQLDVIHAIHDDHFVWLAQLIRSDGRIQREIVADASVTETDDITYQPGEAISYGVTLGANVSDLIGGGTAKSIIGPASTVVAATGVTITGTATVAVGATTQLTGTVAPANATLKQLTWSSANPARATVDQTGKVTGVAAGTALILAQHPGGLFATQSVTVS